MPGLGFGVGLGLGRRPIGDPAPPTPEVSMRAEDGDDLLLESGEPLIMES